MAGYNAEQRSDVMGNSRQMRVPPISTFVPCNGIAFNILERPVITWAQVLKGHWLPVRLDVDAGCTKLMVRDAGAVA